VSVLLLYFLFSTLYLPTASRGDRRRTFPNDFAGPGLLSLVLSQTVDFTADTFFAMSDSVGDL